MVLFLFPCLFFCKTIAILGSTGIITKSKFLPRQKELIRDLTKEFPNIVSIIHNVNEGRTNMILGNDSPNYQTQNSATFVPKPITNYHATHKNNNSSLNFGNDKPTFTS